MLGLLFVISDDEEDICNGILEVISNSKSLKWCNTFQDTKIQVGELKIDLAQRSVSVNDIEVSLTNTEFEILYLLASNPGRVFTLDSFESLAKFTADREQKYQQLETVHLSKGQKLNRLKELSKMYALFAPIQAAYKESQSLKGLAKMRYDKEHKDSLSKYPELRERMQSLLQNGEKITPKQWKAEIQSLQAEYNNIGREQSKTATELAYAEVISYNRKNLERELQNESRQHNRQQSRTKRREEEI